MVDLETLGTGADAVIVSIGACTFGIDEHHLFYSNVDAQSCVDAGLRMDAGTVLWWMRQSDEARKALYEPSAPAAKLRNVLEEFAEWYTNTVQGGALWGNGATFDNVILRNAFSAVGLAAPWKYTDDRCFRTLRAMYPSVEVPPIKGVAHHALDDAIWQAKYAEATPMFAGEKK
jgi:hypothetical protein